MWDNRPSDWEVRRLSDITKRITRKNDGEGHPVMTISAKRGFMLQSDKYSRDMAGQSAERYTLLRKGEFAYNKGNSQTAPQGCIYKLDNDSAVIPFVYYCFSLLPEFNAGYAAHAFQNGVLNRELARAINSGVRNDGLLNLPAEDFFRCQIAVPPLSEQRAIADVMDALEETIAKTEALVDTISGTLASTLDWVLGAFKSASAPIVNFGEVIESTKYGTSAKCDDDSAGFPVLRIPNVLSGGINQAELKYAKLPANEAEKFALRDGDILAVRTNGNSEYVGRMALISGLPEGTIYASYLIRIRVDPKKVLPEFVWLCSETYPLRESLTSAVTTSAGNFNINSDGLRSAKIPLPNLAEQRRIVDAAETLRVRRLHELTYLDQLWKTHAALAQELLSGRIRLPESIIVRHRDKAGQAA